MKTLGLIGGISSFSTSVYYTTINRLVNEHLGGASSAELILHSINFEEFKKLQEQSDWVQIEKLLRNCAESLEKAGASCIVICSNTPHLIANKLRERIHIPLIHIADETAKEIARCGIKRVGLIGTKFTMENSFFTDCLRNFNIETILPSPSEREHIHAAIINEFTRGLFLPETKSVFLKCLANLDLNGAEAVILGCTEISLLLNQNDCALKLFDTTYLHAKAAVNFSLNINE